MAYLITVKANPNNKKKEKMIQSVPFPLSLVPDNLGGFRGLPKKELSKFPGAATGNRVIISVKHGMTLDIETAVEKTTRDILLAYPELIAKDKKSIDGRQRYYFEDLRMQAEVDVDHDMQVFEVGNMVFGMTMEERAKLYEAGYGLNSDLVSPKQITSFLSNKAKDNPALLRSKIKDPELETRFFIAELIKFNVFRKDGNKIYHGFDQNSKLIGLDVAHVIKWMSESENSEYINQLVHDLANKKKTL